MSVSKLAPVAWRLTSRRAPERQGQWWFGFCLALQHAPPPLWFASPLAVSHPRPCRISFPCFRAQPTSHSDPFSPPKGCLFNTTSYPWYLCFLQDPIRMLWGLRFFPKESFPESKYYEGGQIISNYNLQKTGGLSQWRELGKENYRNICMKSNILFLSDQIM